MIEWMVSLYLDVLLFGELYWMYLLVVLRDLWLVGCTARLGWSSSLANCSPGKLQLQCMVAQVSDKWLKQ